MIDAQRTHQLATRRFWSGTVRHLFQALEIDQRISAEEIAESLAVFCQQYGFISGHTLSLLMARSFCVTGDADAAGQILRHDRTHCPHTATWLHALSSESLFPELYSLFSTRVLHPSHLASVGPLWILDLNKVQLTEADCHELILFQTVRVLIEKISILWKESDGVGTLGVKGLHRTMGQFCGRSLSQRLLDYMRATLIHCAEKNRWDNTPSILLMDLKQPLVATKKINRQITGLLGC